MTSGDLVSSAMSRPPIKQLALPPKDGGLGWAENKIRKQLDSEVVSVVQEVALAHPWDFALKIDDTVDSVVNVSDYTLTGTSNDCLQVYMLDYDDSPLVKKTISVLRDYLTRHTPSTILYWTVVKRESGFPVVQITGTPGNSGKEIKYTYWRNDVKLSECPVALDNFLQVALARRLNGVSQRTYQSALVEAVSAYERSDVDPNITVGDKEITAANVRRSNLFGWGGA